MDEKTNTKIEETKETVTKDTEVNTPAVSETPSKPEDAKTQPQAKGGPRNFQKRSHERNMRPKKGRRGPRREERKEFEQKIVSIRRVTRVMAGGRRFSFSVAIVIGDGKGKVGVGIGKGTDTALAIDKAVRDAKKNMIKVNMTKDNSIAHDVESKYCASTINILPAPGKGLVAGSSVRTVLELAGIKDVTAKIFSRSKNRLNNAQAAIKALQTLGV